MKISIALELMLFFLPIMRCQLAEPRISEIRRIRLNAVRVRWTVQNETSFNLTNTRALLFYNASFEERRPQAVRVKMDGNDAVQLTSLRVLTFGECIDACTQNSRCRYVVKSGNTCFLKESSPINGPCATGDECAQVIGYSNEANIYDLPMSTTFRIQIQVYDSKSKSWSPMSQLSASFNTDYVIPIISPLETTTNGIRIKWNVDESLVKPIRYEISLQRKILNDNLNWPDQMQEASSDAYSDDVGTLSASISANECKKACIRNPRCILAVKDERSCYLKALSNSRTQCGSYSACWTLKDYQSFAELTNLPYDEIYRFQVSIFDEYTQEWTLKSAYSQEYDTRINLVISSEKLNNTTYKIKLQQERIYFPITRVKLQISTNGSPFVYDQRAEYTTRIYFLKTYESLFNTNDLVNVGRLDETLCLQSCYDDQECVGVKLRDGLCYKTKSFNPFTADGCFSSEKCYSITNTVNELTLGSINPILSYKVRIEYLTKFGKTGFSNAIDLITNTPVIPTNSTSYYRFNATESAKFECQADSFFFLTIGWRFNNDLSRPLDTISYFSNSTSKSYSTLNFNNLTRKDNGSYSCIANAYVVSTIYLFIPSVPSKPKILNLTSIGTSFVYLSWQIDDDGDYAVQKLLIESKENNGNTASFERELKLSMNTGEMILEIELKNDATVRLRLQNALGNSEWSDGAKFNKGLSTTEIVVAIVVPIVVLILIAVAVMLLLIYYRKKLVRRTYLSTRV